MGTVIFEGDPPYGALVGQSGGATPGAGFVTVTLTLFPDASSQGVADLLVILKPEAAKRLGVQLQTVADTATRWASMRRGGH
jgi:hypothetical protein